MKKPLLLFLLAAVLLGGCLDAPNPLPTTAVPPERVTPLPEWDTPAPGQNPVQIYFTSPGDADAGSRALEAALVADINAARERIDLAMYNFSLRPAADALIAAHRRGVAVRLVADSDALDGTQLSRVQSAGIPVIGDRREGLMHNKFMVVDGALLWTGSLNLTGSGTYNDNNNMARILSPDLAQNYSVEFEEMFANDQFGAGSPADTPNPRVTLPGGAVVENYFSPDDNISPRLVDLVEDAQTSVDFLAYSFTSDPLADALIERFQAGVSVRGVFDENSYRSNTGGEYLRLQRAQMNVRLDGNPNLMHHKVIVIDAETVVLGSYNFTRAADRTNDENILVIHDPVVAAAYLLEFESLYRQAAP